MSSELVAKWLRDNSTPEKLSGVDEKAKSIARDELRYIDAHPGCGNADIKLQPVDGEKLKALLSARPFDPEVMHTAACAVHDTITRPKKSATSVAMVREFLNGLKRIGEPSAVGMALASQKTGLIIKTTQQRASDASLLHEFFVSIATNKLREWCLNFVYVLDAFNCSAPILEVGGKDVATYCEGTPGYTYVIYENVAPSVSIAQYIANRNVSSGEIINVLYQLALALRLAHLYCDFTHYDLHSGNVLVRTVTPDGQPVFLPYPKKGAELLISTRAVPVIIDYGSAHVRIDGKHAGNPLLPQYGVSADISFPMHDWYKLIVTCGIAAAGSQRPEIFALFDTLFKFFNTGETLNETIARQTEFKTFYFLPPNVTFTTISHDDFIAYFEQQFSSQIASFVRPGSDLRSIPTGRILNCTATQNCMSPRSVEEYLGMYERKADTDTLKKQKWDTFTNSIDPLNEAIRALGSGTWAKPRMGDLTSYWNNQVVPFTRVLDKYTQTVRAFTDGQKGEDATTKALYTGKVSSLKISWDTFIAERELQLLNDMKDLKTQGLPDEWKENFNKIADYYNAFSKLFDRKQSIPYF